MALESSVLAKAHIAPALSIIAGIAVIGTLVYLGAAGISAVTRKTKQAIKDVFSF